MAVCFDLVDRMGFALYDYLSRISALAISISYFLINHFSLCIKMGTRSLHSRGG